LKLNQKTSLIDYEIASIHQRLDALKHELEHNYLLLKQYEETELPLAKEIERTASRAYELRDIDFFQYSNNLDMALKINLDYWNLKLNYNKSYLEIKYFTF
jgi:hypothetical protein